jgi:hypothetical protein
MKPAPRLSTTLIAVAGSLIGVWGLYLLETLVRSPAETMLARGFGALILGSFLVTLAYAQSLRETHRRAHDPAEAERPQADARIKVSRE